MATREPRALLQPAVDEIQVFDRREIYPSLFSHDRGSTTVRTVGPFVR
jgi:hypothetical protein